MGLIVAAHDLSPGVREGAYEVYFIGIIIAFAFYIAERLYRRKTKREAAENFQKKESN